MNTAHLTQEARDRRGFILIEVAIAMVILALLVVPLAAGMQTAIGRSVRVRAQAQGLSVRPDEATIEDPWEWGTRVTSIRWQPGPTLYVNAEGRSGSECVVGLWVDGWFLGERPSDAGGCICVGASDWSGETGRELVVRARQSEEAWGPPRRTVIPEGDGSTVGETAGHEAVAGNGSITDGQTVAHVPTLANPPVEVLQSDVLLEEGPLGLLFLLSPATCGRCDLSLDDQLQSWQVERGRALDVYF
jgi:hypothetical protein